MSGRVIQTLEQLEQLDFASLPMRPEPQVVLMCTPDYFDVVDVKNDFMEGRVGTVDKKEAVRQWETLRDTYTGTGHIVEVIEGVEGLEDMVFAANQVLPGCDESGQPYVVLSHMRHESRRREVFHYRDWFKARGYRIVELPGSVPLFEGMGDAIWHPGKQLIWGGYGHRTSVEAYEALASTLRVTVVALELVRPRFYHLDTAFSVLTQKSALIFPEAFSTEGLQMIGEIFSELITVSGAEATANFACNAHALDDGTVIMQAGAIEATTKLRESGFRVIEVETGEFMKSGGSVFCMKQMIY